MVYIQNIKIIITIKKHFTIYLYFNIIFHKIVCNKISSNPRILFQYLWIIWHYALHDFGDYSKLHWFFSGEKIPVFVIRLESKDIFYIASMTEHSAISRDNSQSSTIVTEMIKAYCIIQERRNKSLILADFTHHPRVNRSEMLIEIKGGQQSNNPEQNLLAERTLTMTKTSKMHILLMAK